MISHYPNWPKKGEKMKFIGAGKFHFFTDVIDNAKTLTIGDILTVSCCSPASSWCPIKFVETGDLTFEAAWFERIKI